MTDTATPGAATGNGHTLARARDALGTSTGPRFDAALVPADEAAELAATLGARLAAARAAAGLTRTGLALAAGCSQSTANNLERGKRRPRRSLLASLAAVLDPADDGAALTLELMAAAGPSLRPDTPGSLRRRQRAVDRAQRARRIAATAALRAAGSPPSLADLPTERQLERMTPAEALAAVTRYLDSTRASARHTANTPVLTSDDRTANGSMIRQGGPR